MRKVLCSSLAAAFVAGALISPAIAGKGHVMTAPYDFDLTKPGASAWYGDDYGIFFGDAAVLPVPRGHRSVQLMVMDDSGDAVSAAAWQEGDAATVFCETSKSIPVQGGQPLFVQVIVDVTTTTGNGCATPALPTTGRVMAHFK